MKLKKNIVILSILGIIAVIILIAESKYNKPHLNVAEANPEISVSSKILVDDFRNDEPLANSKYLDEVIQVNGTISKINIVKGNVILTLGKGHVIGNILCHLSPKENEKAKALKKGQTITVKGICTGYLLDVIVVQAVLIN